MVEDNPSLLQGLVAYFEATGFEVDGVGDLASAEALLGGRAFDFLVTDLDLPDGTGLDLVLRARDSQPELVPILVTGYGSTAVRKQALELGCAGYLEKPFDPAALLRIVRDSEVLS